MTKTRRESCCSRFSHPVLALVIFFVAASVPFPSAAQGRPSLIDLDARLREVVDGLCDGNSSICGTEPALPIAGQVEIYRPGSALKIITADFVALTFHIGTHFCCFSLGITLAAHQGNTADFMNLYLDQTTPIRAAISVREDPKDPDELEEILALYFTQIDSVSQIGDGGGTIVNFGLPESIRFSWLGRESALNYGPGSPEASGCEIPDGEQHVALAGNDAHLLNRDEIETDFSLDFPVSPDPISSLTLSYTQTPGASSACFLRSVTDNNRSVGIDFHLLSPLSDTFFTQLRSMSVEMSEFFFGGYWFEIQGSTFREGVFLTIGHGNLISRTFSPVDGSETSSNSRNF